MVYDIYFDFCVSGCTCTADDGACKHASAFLFSICSFDERHRDRHTQVGTDLPCKWDKPRRESRPLPFNDISLNPSSTRPSRATFVPVLTTCPHPFDRKAWLQLVGDGVASHYLDSSPSTSSSASPVHQPSPPSLATLKNQHSPTSVSGFLPHFNTLLCNDIFSLTTDQTESEEWHEQRKGRITASIAHTALHARRPCSIDSSIIRTILGLNTFKGNSSTRYGNEMEGTALELYKKTMLSSHQNVTISPSGLIVRPDLPHLGASPDALIKCDCHGEGVVEIKCPSSAASLTLKEYATLKSSPLHFDENDKPQLKKGKWMSQIVMQMALSGRHYADFVLFTGKPQVIHVERIHFIEEIWGLGSHN